MSRTFHSGTSDNRDAYVTEKQTEMQTSCKSQFCFSATATSLFTHRYTASRAAAYHNEVVVVVDVARISRLRSIARILQVALRANEDFQQAHEEHELASAA
jgi:hypothetical protein